MSRLDIGAGSGLVEAAASSARQVTDESMNVAFAPTRDPRAIREAPEVLAQLELDPGARPSGSSRAS
jgi:hypothetical protein